MKYFVFIDIDFCKNAALLMREILSRDPEATFCGIYGATPNVLADFRSTLPPDFPMASEVPSLNALEMQWPQTGDPKRLDYFEKLLGIRAVNECQIGDKYVGMGYISTGHIYDSPLKRALADTDAQRRYLAGMFDFLFDYLGREKPDVLFFYAVAGAFAIACKRLADHFGISYRKPLSTRLADIYAIATDEREAMPHVIDRFETFIARPELANPWRQEANDFLTRFREHPTGPSYQAQAESMLSTRLPLKSLFFLLLQALHPTYHPKGAQVPYPSRTLSFYFTQRWGVRHWFNGPEWKGWADIKDRLFAYYPLHYDPEATTMILSPMLTDQVAIVEALSKAIPSNWTLAVKEHRSMMGRRPRTVYEKLRRLPKVELIHPYEDPYPLIRGARLVTTISGTSGIEAMLLGKVPLFLGNMYAQAMEQGLVHCSDFASLSYAVEMALQLPPVTTERLELFIAAIISHGFHLPKETFINESHGGSTEQELENNASTMAEALLASLAQCGKIAQSPMV